MPPLMLSERRSLREALRALGTDERFVTGVGLDMSEKGTRRRRNERRVSEMRRRGRERRERKRERESIDKPHDLLLRF